MSASIGVLLSRLRAEDKMILTELERRGIAYDRIDDGAMTFALEERRAPWSIVLDRSLSFGRALGAARLLEARRVRVVNPSHVIQTCGDKLATQVALENAGVACPRTRVAFSPESALAAAEELGYPVVVKPTVGSWGRLVARLNDRDAAEAVFEDRATLGGWTHQTFYLQELVRKPGRDIRLFVVGGEAIAAIYRVSDHWITNTARGATTENCPVDDELAMIAARVHRAIPGEIIAIDLVEDQDGRRLVLEVNHGMEFRNSIGPTGVNIPARIVDELLRCARADERVEAAAC